MFTHILCPIDGSNESLLALDAAAELACEQGAGLTICTVVSPARASAMAFCEPSMSAACFDALDKEAKAMVDTACVRVNATIPAQAVSLSGAPVDVIVDYAAASQCDLIVMGSHGRSGISRALLGSVAKGVVRHAAVPVLIVRHPLHRPKGVSVPAAEHPQAVHS